MSRTPIHEGIFYNNRATVDVVLVSSKGIQKQFEVVVDTGFSFPADLLLQKNDADLLGYTVEAYTIFVAAGGGGVPAEIRRGKIVLQGRERPLVVIVPRPDLSSRRLRPKKKKSLRKSNLMSARMCLPGCVTVSGHDVRLFGRAVC